MNRRNRDLKIKWIFFDIGSTVMDEEQGYVARYVDAEAEMIAKFGRKLSYEGEIKPLLIEGACLRMAPATYVSEKLGITRTKYHRDLEAPYPSTLETLRELKKNYKIGVIANQPPKLEESLVSRGFEGVFDRVFGSDDLGMDKPEHRFFLHAMREVGCAPEEAVMVGDRIDNDIIPAKELGMHSIRVRTGYFAADTPKNDAEVADVTIDSLPEIIEALKKIENM